MKRIVLIVTAAAVALTPLAASAAPAGKRTVTFDYAGFSSADSPVVSFHASGVCNVADSCMEFDTKKGEKTVEIKGSDPRVGLQVWTDGAYADTVVTFCGAGKINVSPKSVHAISVRPSLGSCGGFPDSGTITATILTAKK